MRKISPLPLLLSLIYVGFITGNSNAGLITHTDYSSGATITASGQNANENAVFNEFNGNIEAVNIKSGTITTTQISASAGITAGQLATNVQSTFTYVNTFGTSRRPNLVYISATTVDIEANTGTTNQTCVQFPDSQRCVTEDTSSTSVNRRAITSETASFSGTKNSGMAPGEPVTNNTWYAAYLVKATDNTTDFVIALSTNTPVISNYSRLNTLFGSNGWVYAGMVRNGDNGSSAGNILSFSQAGPYTRFNNSIALNNTIAGLLLSSGTAATSITYTYSAGTLGGRIPSHLTFVLYGGNSNGAAANSTTLSDSSASRTYDKKDNVFTAYVTYITILASEGVKIANSGGSGTSMGVVLGGYYDGVLGVGYNPQI